MKIISINIQLQLIQSNFERTNGMVERTKFKTKTFDDNQRINCFETLNKIMKLNNER